MDSVSVAPSAATVAAVDSTGEVMELYTEIDALHLSRQDNPFIQKQVKKNHFHDNRTSIQAISSQPRYPRLMDSVVAGFS